MSQERLTRHEITWLLAQEARGAAKTLRDEVSILHAPEGTDPASEPRLPVATTLDALDDAIEMLSALNTGARGTKARRGRIDLASLLYEIAPNARIAIEPGAGTEVLGDESDLRRMLSVLVTQASAGGVTETEVRIRRHGDWVKISVELGPDVAASGELERRWLSRMATRHGGTVELEAGTQSLFLQADGASDQREVTELRRELEQAQQLGEAYARELAGILAHGDVKTEPPPAAVGTSGLARFDAVRGAAAGLERTLRSLGEALRADAQRAERGSDGTELAQQITRRAQTALDAAHELALVGAGDPAERAGEIDLAAEARAASEAAKVRAGRQGVEIDLELPERLIFAAPRSLARALFDLLFWHAIAATPRGARVRFSLYQSELGVVVAVEDGGPQVPEAARASLIRHEIDPSSVGRPGGLALLGAHAAADALGAELALRETASGAAETWLLLPLGKN